MRRTRKTTHKTHEATSAGRPATTAQDLSRSPAWLEVCQKLGYDPFEWMTYKLPWADSDECRRRLEEREAEQAAIHSDYEASMTHLLAIVGFAPKEVRKALGWDDWEDYHA